MSSFEVLRIMLSRLVDPYVLLLLVILGLSLFSSFRAGFRNHLTNGTLFSAVILYGLSLPFCANFIVEKWEQDITKFTNPHSTIDYIVVLGCGHTNDPRLPLSNHLSTCSMRRLAEGIFIQKELNDVPMIFTGGNGGDTESHAQTMYRVAQAFGIQDNKMITSEFGNNTLEEADALKDLLTNKSIVLVTSASHMQRATLVFNNLGVSKIFPAPTNFYVVGQEPHFLLTLIPSINNLNIVAKFCHEEFGTFYTNVMNTFIIEETDN